MVQRCVEAMSESQATKVRQYSVVGRTRRIDDVEFTLIDYGLILWNYRKRLVFSTFIAMLAIGTYSFTRPRLYAAKASIVPPAGDTETGIGMRMGLARNPLVAGIMGGGTLADMFVGILGSRAVSDALIEKFDLVSVYEDVETLADARIRLKARSAFEASLDGIVKITVEDEDPNLAATLANAFVEELDKINKALSGSRAASKRQFLEIRLAEIRKELGASESIPALEERTKEELFEMLAQEYELARIDEAKSMPTIQVLDFATPPEKGVARGTVKKSAISGAIVFFLYGSWLIMQEYFRACYM